jgi:hypothetical protein
MRIIEERWLVTSGERKPEAQEVMVYNEPANHIVGIIVLVFVLIGLVAMYLPASLRTAAMSKIMSLFSSRSTARKRKSA